ncbi:MAG: hypothetical protein HYS81_03080 [Candidatus Aenigmatarchaeota archaeon]|nr:MAG: hypothetical protein HYS81_03080 [Candidatus Aenigmarchaeota archaeon]
MDHEYNSIEEVIERFTYARGPREVAKANPDAIVMMKTTPPAEALPCTSEWGELFLDLAEKHKLTEEDEKKWNAWLEKCGFGKK